MYIWIIVLLLTSKLAAYEFIMAAMFKNEAPYLREWILYHKMVGVEHFWLYDNESTDNWKEVLAPFIEEGLVDVIPCRNEDFNIEKKEEYPFTLQVCMMREVLKKAKGQTKWIAILDIDEFLLPRKEKTVTECLDAHFSEASAVFVNWLNFGTGGISVAPGEPLLCKLTAASMRSYPKNGNGKSIWRPEDVLEDDAWWIHWAPLKEDASYVNGDGNIVSFEGEGATWDWQMHDKHLRIHHYFLRDENFFLQKRLGAAQRGEGVYSEETLWEVYDLLSCRKENAMIHFIKTQYPKEYEKIWKP
jgi:hypothetical protein